MKTFGCRRILDLSESGWTTLGIDPGSASAVEVLQVSETGGQYRLVTPNSIVQVPALHGLNSLRSLGGLWCATIEAGGQSETVILDGEFNRVSSFDPLYGDCRTTPEQTIWVGYSDQTISENYGGISHNGLACLDRNGRLLFGYNDAVSSTPACDDCYAMNFAGSSGMFAFMYTSSGFSVIRIRDNIAETICESTPFCGVQSIAVSGTSFLISGLKLEDSKSWTNSPLGFFVVSMDDGSAEEIALVTDGGTRLCATTWHAGANGPCGETSHVMYGVSESLFITYGDAVYEVNVFHADDIIDVP